MEFGGTDLDSGEMVKEIYRNYKVRGESSKKILILWLLLAAPVKSRSLKEEEIKVGAGG